MPTDARQPQELPQGGKLADVAVNDFDDVPAPSSINNRSAAAADSALMPRVRTPFTAAEDDAILEGMSRFSGPTRFADIFRHFRDVGGVWHESRTPAGIADHYLKVLRRRRLLKAA